MFNNITPKGFLVSTRVIWIVSALIFFIFSCKKDKQTPIEEPEPEQLIEVAGHWEWVNKEWIMGDNEYGFVYGAWATVNGIYCFVQEDDYLKFQLKYFDGNTWTTCYTSRQGGDGHFGFRNYQGSFFMAANTMNGSGGVNTETYKCDNGNCVLVSTESTGDINLSPKLVEYNSELYKLAPIHSPGYLVNGVEFKKWNGTNWVSLVPRKQPVETADLPKTVILNGSGKLFVIVKGVGESVYNIYSYGNPDTLTKYTSITYPTSGKGPFFTVLGDDIYVSEPVDLGYPGISRINSDGSTTTIVNVAAEGKDIFDYGKVDSAIYFTKGYSQNQVPEIFLKEGNITYQYSALFDSMSIALSDSVDFLGNLEAYNSSYFFKYNGDLYCISNGEDQHSQTPSINNKPFLAKYIED